MSAFNFIRSIHSDFIQSGILKKMSKTHPQAHEDYHNEIKKKITQDNVSGPIQGSGPRYSGLTKPMKLSPELADIVGKGTASRAVIIQQLWAYLMRNKLQDPEDETYFIPDSKMAKVFGNEKIRAFAMAKFISSHISWF